MKDEFIQVADITDIDLNQSQSVQLDKFDILICNTEEGFFAVEDKCSCLLYTSPSPRDVEESRMPSSA